jgi:hypothetical protein
MSETAQMVLALSLGLAIGTAAVVMFPHALTFLDRLRKRALSHRPPMPHREIGGKVIADLFQLTGFGLMVTGVALYSVPMALILAGAALFHAGGLAARR